MQSSKSREFVVTYVLIITTFVPSLPCISPTTKCAVPCGEKYYQTINMSSDTSYRCHFKIFINQSNALHSSPLLNLFFIVLTLSWLCTTTTFTRTIPNTSTALTNNGTTFYLMLPFVVQLLMFGTAVVDGNEREGLGLW